MKKILLVIFLVILANAYEGCGENKKEALNNLAESIYVKVSNNFQKEVSYSKNKFFEVFSKDIKTKSSQSSDVVLKNVIFTKKDKLICASITESNLLKTAKATKKELINFDINNLPADFVLKQKKAKELKSKISFVRAVLGSELNPYEIRKLDKLEKQLDNILNKSEVIFDVNIPNAQITLSGIKYKIHPSEPILLEPGSYSYTVKVAGKCPVNGNFEIKKGKIKHIKANLGDYPQITIRANVNAIARINGKSVPLNKPYVINKCNGAAVYVATYEGDKESGSVNLEPNLKKEIDTDFLTRTQKRALKDMQTAYNKAKGIVLSYGYAVSNNKEWDSEKRISLRYFQNYGIYQIGSSLVTGTQDRFTAKSMNELEILFNFKLQLSEFNGNILRIKSFLFVPYVGIDGGWDIYKFADGGSLADNSNIIRGNVGFNIVFHKQLGINFEYAKGFKDKEDNVFSIGLILMK